MKKIVDLCAGTGAFSLAFKTEQLVFSNDYDKKSKIIYDYNFEEKLNTEDITQVDTTRLPDHDIMTCGFPCQPFSLSGKKLGFTDIRSQVFWKLIDIMKIKKPQCVILENVKNIMTHNNGNTLKNIRDSIENSGYDLSYKILNTSKITGIPQNRERVYFICMRKDLNIQEHQLDSILQFNEVEKKDLKDFLETKVDDNFYYTEKDKIYNILKENVVEKNEVYQYRRTYIRKNMSGECPTLTAVMGTGGHNVPIILDNIGIRKLTPKECFNLQGFPDSYKLPDIANCHLYKLAGNSVTFPIVEELSTRILKLLV
jgi:DNA (cytosine-5)-methyltransferase 1